DVIVVGSGYGGAITAARIACAPLSPKKSVCILERGREWPVGQFPDTLPKVSEQYRTPILNPTGLYDLPVFKDIAVLKGCGLGGTSLVNANVAIIPDDDVFLQASWPRSINRSVLQPYYDAAMKMLASRPHPRATELLKVQALERRAREIGYAAVGAHLNVNFDIDGPNPHGVPQKPCIDCGDCLTGCNVGAKNTLYMNYLPVAAAAGAEIFTEAQVDLVEKLASGGWRIHGRNFERFLPKHFTLDAGTVILAAGALGSPEILLRSEIHGLSLSPRAGTGFSGNGDFFGFAFNGEYRTNVLGSGTHPEIAWKPYSTGPSIVGVIRYDGKLPLGQRIAVEDLSFPSAYVSAAMIALGALGGELTVAGHESEEKARRALDNPFAPYQPDNAMNHTMFYLVMGHDNAQGTMRLDTSVLDPNGRLEIEWDGAGSEPLFTLMNEELRRHARALDADFISLPAWHLLHLRKLVTAHPLGGLPLGEDHLQGAVDEFGRVFTGDGIVHEGLFVADGSVIPSALGVNPLLTISAYSERMAEKLGRNFQGEAYPAPATATAVHFIDPIAAAASDEADLERIFTRVETGDIGTMVNGGEWSVDTARGIVRNDTAWRGFFPRGHVFNRIASAFSEGFKKKFFRTPTGVAGITSDSDGHINVANTLEEVTLEKNAGTLAKGKYIVLKYTQAPWTGFYDVFKVINQDLLIGRACFDEFPHGVRLVTFPMTRIYPLANLTASDHAQLYARSAAPSPQQLAGVWQMRAVSNAGDTGVMAYLKFDLKPDGRLEARYRLLGLLEGLSAPVFMKDHFQLNDFTPFHDEIRLVAPDFMLGKYTTAFPPALKDLFGPGSLGLLHLDEAKDGSEQLSLYYTLTRASSDDMPPNIFLEPLLDMHLPSGVGLSFDEQMTGVFFPGLEAPASREDDVKLESVAAGSQNATDCSFQVKIDVRDLNEFLLSREHEAQLSGTIRFGDFQGAGEATFTVDPERSTFNYLRVNPQTQETEIDYHIYFEDAQKRDWLFTARKYLQRNPNEPMAGAGEILHNYTTAYCHLSDADTGELAGAALLKFKTFENFAALRSFAEFAASFRVTGTDEAALKVRARLRFLAFTSQFIVREYEPYSFEGEITADAVREDVARGAAIPDEFSDRPTAELQEILRGSQTLPLETLINRGGVKIDYASRRIWRDSFWKGSFAKDSLLGREERLRNALFSRGISKAAMLYTGGSFWKRFDSIHDGQATGYVVNYGLRFLPGKPVVKLVKYPDDRRKYFRSGQDVLLLNYLNEPYRIVYDTIKAIDENNCIGVMHLGKFPDGLEFAAFVMARNNYPFEKMSVPDHQAIFYGDHVHAPAPAEIAGGWEGHVIFLTRPDTSLLNQVNPVAFRLNFKPTPSGVEGRYRFGLLSGPMKVQFTEEFVRLIDFTSFHDEIRIIDDRTMIGKWVSPSGQAWLNNGLLRKALEGYLEPGQDRFAFYYLLTRV
ncbi:MAG: GMC family oxidoreductase N-terminal domain-containing protein, partial [Terriglobia bacterium]